MATPAMTDRRLRVLLAAAEDTGDSADTSVGAAERVGRLLRDAGHEVVFVGAVPSPEVMTAIAVQEDVDAMVFCTHGDVLVEADEPDVREALHAYASK